MDVKLFLTRRYIDESMRAEMEKIVDIRMKLSALERREEETEKEMEEISEDPERLRKNIQSLGETAEARQLIARYVAKVGEQETRLEQLTAERKKLVVERRQVQSELGAAVRALSFNRRIAD
jgi:chromosome segregation ATPase